MFDYSLVAGTLRDGATRDESAVLRALARACGEGCHRRFRQIETTADGDVRGWYFTDGGKAYQTSLFQCGCMAGSRDVICKHRVALADLVGELDALVLNFYHRFVAPGAAEQAAA